MNKNLVRLNELVMETNKVVANLNQETQDIMDSNQEERSRKFICIREYLLDCFEIVSSLKVMIRVPLNIKGVYFCGHSAESVKLVFNPVNNQKDDPITFDIEYTDRHGDHRTDREGKIIADTNWLDSNNRMSYGIFPCWFSEQNKFDFVDNWDQESFEKLFAAEIEKAITEKANAANDKYQAAISRQESLRR